jgi:hypothetical protein
MALPRRDKRLRTLARKNTVQWEQQFEQSPQQLNHCNSTSMQHSFKQLSSTASSDNLSECCWGCAVSWSQRDAERFSVHQRHSTTSTYLESEKDSIKLHVNTLFDFEYLVVGSIELVVSQSWAYALLSRHKITPPPHRDNTPKNYEKTYYMTGIFNDYVG